MSSQAQPEGADISEPRGSMMQRGIRSLPFLLTLSVGVLGFFALSGLRQPPETQDHGRLAPLVQATTVQPGRSVLHLEVDGEVVPFRQVVLSAQIAGRIVEKTDACQAGHYVRQGELLLRIDPRDYDLEVRRIQQLIKQTEVNVEELDVDRSNTDKLVLLAEQDVELQEKELQRVRTLIERQAASQADVDSALRGRIQAINAMQMLRNQSHLLETRRGKFLTEKDRLLVELERATLDRQRCDVHSPMDGVIVEDTVERDDFVQPGGSLLKIEDADRVEVRFDLKLSQLRWVWESNGVSLPGQVADNHSFELPSLPVSISYDAEGSRYVWQGVLSRYDRAGLNPATRTVPCIAEVESPRGGQWELADPSANRLAGPPTLLRGMFVSVTLEVPASRPLLEVPTVALRPGNRLWLVRDNQLRIVDVDVAQTSDDRVLLFSDGVAVQTGDLLVVSPLSLAVNDMIVRVEESDPVTMRSTDIDEPFEVDAAEVTLGSEAVDNAQGVSR